MSPHLQSPRRRRRAHLLAHLVAATLLASLLVPTFSSEPAGAVPLSINEGEAVNLSNSAGRSLSSATASSGSDGYVVWLEEGNPGGITFRALRNNGVSPDEPKRLGAATTQLIGKPAIAASGDDVFVAWSSFDPSARLKEIRDVVVTGAISHDRGRTFELVDVSDPRSDEAWHPEIAVGDGAFHTVYHEPDTDRVVLVTLDGDATHRSVVGRGHARQYDVAAAGRSLHVVWNDESGEVRSASGRADGQHLSFSEVQSSAGAAAAGYAPRVAMEDNHVLIAFLERAEGAAGNQLVTRGSNDFGVSWGRSDLAPAPSPGNSGLDVAIGNGTGHVAWIAGGRVWSADSERGNLTALSAAPVAPAFSYDDPEIAVAGDSTYITWFGPGTAAGDRMEVYTAARRPGDVWTTSVTSRTPTTTSYDAHVIGFPDMFATVWGEIDGDDVANADHEIWTRLASYGLPDLQVLDVRTVQGPRVVQNLVDNRPTVAWARVRNAFAHKITTTVTFDLRYTGRDGTFVNEMHVVPVTVHPGVQEVWWDPGEDFWRPRVGDVEVRATIDVEESVVESDESNNTDDITLPVVDTKPMSMLFTSLTWVGAGDPSSCDKIARMAVRAQDYVKGAWPVDPAEVSTSINCQPVRLGMNNAPKMWLPSVWLELLARFRFDHHDQVVMVVPDGWIGRHLFQTKDWGYVDLTDVAGISPREDGTKFSIIEERMYSGAVAAHEIAHTTNWIDPASGIGMPGQPDHIDDPAPGYWVDKHQPVDMVDLMAPRADAGGEVRGWIGTRTWEHLVTFYARPTRAVAAASRRTGAAALTGAESATSEGSGSIGIAGAVRFDGTAVNAAWTELPHQAPTTPLGVERPGGVTVRYLDAEDAVMGQTQLPVVATSEVDDDDKGGGVFGGFLPLPAQTARIRLLGPDGTVIADRERSDHPPTVAVTPPTGTVQVGATVDLVATTADADGDDLTTTFEYSTDGGRTWVPLGGDGSSSYELRVTRQLLSEDVRIRATTTDGWRTAQAVSEPFSVTTGVTNGRVAYVNLEGATPTVHTMNPDGSGDLAVEAPVGLGQPDWSHDGSKLAVVYDTADGHVGDDIALVNADGTGLTRLHLDKLLSSDGVTYDNDWTCPRLSPNGEWLVVNDQHVDWQGVPAWRMYKFRLDGMHSYQYSTFHGSPGYDCGSFSPDGTRFVHSDSEYLSGDDPYMVDTLFPSPGPEAYDDNWLTPTHRRHPDYQYERQAAWAPDGSAVAYQRAHKTTGATSLWSVEYTYQTYPKPEPKVLVAAQDGVELSDPRWSPETDWILYNRITGAEGARQHEVWRIKPDGTGAERFATPGEAAYATWQRRPAVTDPGTDEPAPVEVDARGPYTTDEGTAVRLAATGSDGKYAWDLDGDGEYDDATGRSAELIPDVAGTLTARVQVTTEDGSTAGDAAQVTVAAVDPTVTGASGSLDDDDAVVTATVTDPGATTGMTATIDWGSGPVPVELLASGDSLLVHGTHAYGDVLAPDEVTLTVDDGVGGQSTERVTLTQGPADRAPVTRDVAIDVPQDGSVIVDGFAEDPELRALAARVMTPAGHGTVTVVDGGPGGSPTVRYAPEGSFTGQDHVVVEVSDGTSTAQARITFTVVPSQITAAPTPTPTPTPAPAVNQAPTARIKVSNGLPRIGRSVRLSAAGSSDPETASNELRYEWDFHDGGAAVDATEQRVTRRFPSGRHRVSLTVVDSAGARATTSTWINPRALVRCAGERTSRTGSWRTIRPGDAGPGCDNLGSAPGEDALRLQFTGDSLKLVLGRAEGGGTAVVRVDGRKVGTVSFDGDRGLPSWVHVQALPVQGGGRHVVELEVLHGAAFVRGFLVKTPLDGAKPGKEGG